MYMVYWTVIEETDPRPHAQGFGTDEMVVLYRAVIARLEPLVKVPQATIERTVSIHEKIRHIQQLISSATKVKFSSVLEKAESRTEVVVCFLALLELVKQRDVTVSQDKHWGDITIEKLEKEAATVS